METNTQLTKQKGETAIGAFSFKSMAELNQFGDEMVKSGLTPLKTGGAAVAAILMGRELGLEPMVSLNNIIPINGKATLGIHLITSILLKAGITIEKLRDYEPCTVFCLKDDTTGKPYLKDDKPTILRTGFFNDEIREYEVRSKTITDYKTVVRLKRKVKQEDGTYVPMEITSSFSWNDCVIAGLSEKDNWKKYPSQMCYNRALAFAGRAIAADALLGMYETSELADAHGMSYTMTEEGKVSMVEPTKGSNENIEEAQVVNEEPTSAEK